MRSSIRTTTVVHMDHNNATRHTVAERVRNHMESAGVSRGALAKQVGMPGTTLHRCLVATRDFSVTELIAVAEALEVQLSDLLPAEVSA